MMSAFRDGTKLILWAQRHLTIEQPLLRPRLVDLDTSNTVTEPSFRTEPLAAATYNTSRALSLINRQHSMKQMKQERNSNKYLAHQKHLSIC